MRRSASPSKATRSGTPVRAGVRSDPSSSVLKTPFKPLSGLEGRHKSTLSQSGRSTIGKPGLATTAAANESNASTVSARDLRSRTVSELQEEIADMQMILSDKLIAHNAARKQAGLSEQQPEQIVAEYIKLLTEYNKVKDAAQVVFDKIAEIEQLPAKDIHARYGVGDQPD